MRNLFHNKVPEVRFKQYASGDAENQTELGILKRDCN